jgi:hypothetical protein
MIELLEYVTRRIDGKGSGARGGLNEHVVHNTLGEARNFRVPGEFLAASTVTRGWSEKRQTVVRSLVAAR